MLKKRIIPKLLLKNGRMVKGLEFQDFRDTGDPVSASRIYNHQYADELVFLDIDATVSGQSELLSVIEKVSSECFMPLSVGGGIQTLDMARELILAGADKVVLNSVCYDNPELVREIAKVFGEQAVVVSIDCQYIDGQWRLFSHSGSKAEEISLQQHLSRIDALGCGEYLIQSIQHDGHREGYDLDLLRKCVSLTNTPIVIGAGAGHFMHLFEAFENGAHGVGCASIFHFADNNPLRARSYLKNKGIDVRSYK